MMPIKTILARKAACLVLLSALLACGQGETASQESQTKVTNGLAAQDEFPSVIMLQLRSAAGSSICTGTFVNSTQLVTAAHCVQGLIEAEASPGSISFVRKNRSGSSVRVKALSMVAHPDYTEEVGKLSEHDIAVVNFPRGSAPATTPLYAGPLAEGQAFTIVGFGLNNYSFTSQGEQTGGDGSGVKRKGDNKLAQVDGGMLRFYGVPSARDEDVPLGQDSASGSGDSGGPMLVQGALAATTAGGGLARARDEQGQMTIVKASNYVNLQEPSNRAFLRSTLLSTPGW